MKREGNAFTLFEILAVLFIIAMASTYFIPRLVRRPPTVEWTIVVNELNNLVTFARQEAMAHRKNYRLTFHSAPQQTDSVRIEQEFDDVEKPGRKKYQSVSSYYVKTIYELAPAVRLRAVYLAKQEMLSEQRGYAFCYIASSGMVQEVVVQLERKIDTVESFQTLKMNPFFGRFDNDDGLVKPGG